MQKSVVIALLTIALGNMAGPALAERLAIVDVTVLPMSSGDRLEHQTVVVTDGVITEMGPSSGIRLMKGTRRIEGRNRTLMPGIADMHVHVLREPKPSVSVDMAERQAEAEMLSFLATGITTIRNMSGSPRVIQYRDKIASGAMLGPRIVTSSPIIEGARPVWPATSMIVTDPAAVEAIVADFKRQGYDMIKVYHTISASVYDAVMIASRRHGLRVVGHVPFEIGIERALADGQSSIEHLRGYDFDGLSLAILSKDGGLSAERLGLWSRIDSARLTRLAQLTAKSEAWNTPTLTVIRLLVDPDVRAAAAADPAFRLLPVATQRNIANNPLDKLFAPDARLAMQQSLPKQGEFVKMLYESGAGLLTGTDSTSPYLVKGLTVIDEVGEFTRAGIPPMAALQAATINADRYLGTDAWSGSIGIGMRGAMILIDGDPSSDVSAIWRLYGVIVDGHWQIREALMRRIDALKQAN